MIKKYSNSEVEGKFKHLIDSGWIITKDRVYLQKTFNFKNFVEAFSWMGRVAFIAEKLNHHPEWSNVYRTVEISLSTHDSGGLTELDLKFADLVESEV
jgi:4a-hydroxytetrahydrobiopterin dehydratase